jgi:hypothetical protein
VRVQSSVIQQGSPRVRLGLAMVVLVCAIGMSPESSWSARGAIQSIPNRGEGAIAARDLLTNRTAPLHPGRHITAAATASAQRIYFFEIINEPTIRLPLVMHPSSLFVLPHDTWNLENLHWSGWGSPVARATGVSAVDDCEPNCVAGKIARAPAELTLASPGHYMGHKVYRCYNLTANGHTLRDEKGCYP